MNLGKAIQEIREGKGLKQAALAKQVGVDRSSICNYEAGSNYPSIPVLKRIANVLEVNVCEIIAMAEGVTLEPRQESQEQTQARMVLESLDKRDLYKIAAIAAILKGETK